MRDLTPPPIPGDDQIEAAAKILTRLGEHEEMCDWRATYRRDDLRLTGV